MTAAIILFFLHSVLTVFDHNALPVPYDPGRLAVTLIDIARNDAGIGPNPTRGKLANGPFLIDSLTWALHFDIAFGSNAGDVVVQTIKNNGYSFGNHEALRRSTTTADGNLKYYLEGDAIVLNLASLTRNSEQAVAWLTMFYTEENGRVCPRTLELVLTENETVWSLNKKKVLGDC